MGTGNDISVAATAVMVGLDSYWVMGGASRSVLDGPEQPSGTYVPCRAAFVLVTGGPEPTPLKDGDKILKVRIQIIVRSDPFDWDQGSIDADRWREAVAFKPPTGYYELAADSSAPIWAGRNGEDCFRWSINATAKKLVAQ